MLSMVMPMLISLVSLHEPSSGTDGGLFQCFACILVVGYLWLWIAPVLTVKQHVECSSTSQALGAFAGRSRALLPDLGLRVSGFRAQLSTKTVIENHALLGKYWEIPRHFRLSEVITCKNGPVTVHLPRPTIKLAHIFEGLCYDKVEK